MKAYLRSNRAPVIRATLAAVLLACATPARAAFIQLTQDRILAASTSATSMGSGPAPDTQREESSALGNFQRSFYSSSTAQAPPPNQGSSNGTASAAQYAHYNPTAVNARLDLNITASHNGGSSTAGAETNWRTTFRVDAPTDFHLTGRVFLDDFGNLGTTGINTWSFFFSGTPDAGGEPVSFFGDGGSGPFREADRPLDIRGTLQPGYVYRIGGLLSAGKSTEGGVGIFKHVEGYIDANLSFVPEPTGAAVLAMAAGAAMLPRHRRRKV